MDGNMIFEFIVFLIFLIFNCGCSVFKQHKQLLLDLKTLENKGRKLKISTLKFKAKMSDNSGSELTKSEISYKST